MSNIEGITGKNPFGNNDTIAKVSVTKNSYLPIATFPSGGQFILSAYIKADSDSEIRFLMGEASEMARIDVSNTWQRLEMKIDARTNDEIILRLPVNTYYLYNWKIEEGNKATTYTVAPEDTDEEISELNTKYSTVTQTVEGISTTVGEQKTQINGLETKVEKNETNYVQLSDMFQWIVSSGTSSSDFTLTDRMAELTAEIISLNGDVKVDGKMLVDGAVTAEKINVEDLFSLKATIAKWKINDDSISSGSDNTGTYEEIALESLQFGKLALPSYGANFTATEELTSAITTDFTMEFSGIIKVYGDLSITSSTEQEIQKIFRVYDSENNIISEKIVDISDTTELYTTVSQGTYKLYFGCLITYKKQNGYNVNFSFTPDFSYRYINPSSIKLLSIFSDDGNWISATYNGVEVFKISKQGMMYAKNATIEGNVRNGSESNYTEMRSGEINIYKYKEKVSKFNQSGNHFYNGDVYVGKIGTNKLSSDDSKKGLVFDLEKDAAYTAWASRRDETSDYLMKWAYCSKDCDNFSADTLNAGCPLDMHGHELRNVAFEGGGINGTLNFKQIVEIGTDGVPTKWADATLTFTNGILTDATWYK